MNFEKLSSELALRIAKKLPDYDEKFPRPLSMRIVPKRLSPKGMREVVFYWKCFKKGYSFTIDFIARILKDPDEFLDPITTRGAEQFIQSLNKLEKEKNDDCTQKNPAE